MNILILSPFSKPDVGGVESHIEKLTTYLVDEKLAKVKLVTYMPLSTRVKVPKYEVNGNLEIYRMPWFGMGLFRKFEAYFPLNLFYLFPGLAYKFLSTVLSHKKSVDVIHAHGFIAGMIVSVFSGLLPYRKVMSTHAIYGLKRNTFKGMMFRWVLEHFNQILAVGEPSKIEIIELGIDKKRVQVHPNWIEISKYFPIEQGVARKKLNIDEKKFTIAFVGRMIGIKGEKLLLEFAKTTDLDIQFIFIGDGPEAIEIEEASKTFKSIEYLGRIPDEKMREVYCSADLFASPVLYDEGFATVYLESLAYGTPVLTGKRGCLPYFLNDEVAELLDEVNLESVSQAIKKHYFNRDLLINKRNECVHYAHKNFSQNNANIIYNSYLSTKN